MSREDQLGGFEQEEMIEEDGGSTGSVVMEGGVGFSRRPIKELYSVFSRPRNDADRQAGELAARWLGADERSVR